MAVKYYCPKCGRRFVDWGAKKLNYKCPSDTCEEETLLLLGTEPSETADAPQKVKRAKKSKAILPGISSDIDIPELDGDFEEDVDLDEDEDELEEEEEEEEVAPKIKDDDDSDDETSDDVDEDEAFSDVIDLDDNDSEEEED